MVVDDTYIEQSSNLWNGKPLITVVMHQEIAILNEKGLSYATIPLQGMRRFAGSLELTVTDVNGDVVYEAPNTTLFQLQETGNIAVPGVLPGQRIHLTIKGSAMDVLDDFEYVIQRNIPVVRSRFTLASYKSSFGFATKEQGSPKPKTITYREDDDDNFEVYRKEFSLVNPELQLPYLGWADARIPRIRIALENCKQCAGYANSWKNRLPWQPSEDVSEENYESWKDSPYMVPNWQVRAYQLLDSLVPKKLSADSARRKIYDYIQSNFRLDSASEPMVMVRASNWTSRWTVDVGKVAENRRGSAFIISSFYASLLHALGLEASIFVAGSLTDGGIDLKFPSRENRLFWMVQVKEKGGLRALVPYLRGYSYGNYPQEVNTKQGILLGEDKLEANSVAIPPRLQDSIIYDVHIRLDSLGSSAHVSIEPKNLGVDNLRYWYVNTNKQGRKEMTQNWFRDFPAAFTTKQTSESGLSNFHKPFLVKAELKTSGLVVEHHGQKFWRFGMVFDDYMSRLDSARSETAYFNVPVKYREHVYVPKTSAPAKISWNCEQVSLPLMETSCSQSEEDGMLVFHRTVEIKVGKMTTQQIKEHIPAIRRNNKVRDSFLLF
jgi:hypothetical protein